MKIALVFPFYDRARAPDDALAAFPILRELPRELAARGHNVLVLALAANDARVVRAGVRYEFVRPDALTGAVGRLLQRWKPRYGAAYYQVSPRLARRLRAARPDVVHVFGLTMDWHLALLARTARHLRAPLVVHYHGGLPEVGRYRRLQRHNLRQVARAFFTTREQADAWINAGLLRPDQTALLPETSSAFVGLPRAVARAQTSLTGDPVCLSVGRLAPIKDPLTMLRGFALAAEQLPAARLYCFYLTDELLPELRAFVASVPGLAERVEFRGRAPADAMEAIYASADVLLQASLREWSGLALLEALACGCLPLVTDIPAFATLTDGGRHACLFPPGNRAELAAALVALDPAKRTDRSRTLRAYFQQTLSFAALARRLDEQYAALAPAEYNQADGYRNA